MKCYICMGNSDTTVSQRFNIGEGHLLPRNEVPKIHVCFDCMINRRGCITAWQNRSVCVCERCE